MKTTIYSLGDIRTIVAHFGLDRLMDDTIAELARVCTVFDPDTHVIPVRDGFEYQHPQVGLIEWMPAMKSGEEVVIKIVGYHPENPRLHTLPSILSTVLCFDTRHGHLMAAMDGNLITAVRTGAASAVASRILARPDSSVLGIIGCGAQSISQLHALSRVFDLRQVLVYDTDPTAQASFAQRTVGLNLPDIEIIPAPVEKVVCGADILCTATSVAGGAGPVFADRLLQPWVHINAVGADFPGKIEIPRSLLARSLVCPDFEEQALREGECQQLERNQVGPDLLQLLKEQARYSAARERTTVFDSTGWALEDYVTMKLLCGYGADLGCGSEISMANIAVDPHNPYAAFGTNPKISRKVV